MNWVLVVTLLINGQPHTADKLTFKTKETCLDIAKQIEKLELVKAYDGKASCEKAS